MRHALTFFLLLSVFAVVPTSVFGATNLEVAGWLPYWRADESARDARRHLDDIDTLHPFVFIVQPDGTLRDEGDLDDSDWKRLFREAKREDVEVIPTVMWSDGGAINAILSDRKERKDHIEEIVDMVEDGDFDGVDIDYESKLASTKDHFSAFLEELKDELGKKTLTCTIEPRTPPDSLYRTIPAVIQYANDFDAIAEHCDRVEIMTYDQQRADIKLNDERKGEPYMPLADIDWVEKVVELALKDIPANKIMLGVPTYGHHYTVTVAPDWFRDYSRIGAFNMPHAEDIADDYDVTPSRTAGGELSFTYFPKSSPFHILEALPVPQGTRTGFEAAAQALLFANATKMNVPVNYVLYEDAGAIKDKLELAARLGLRGVAVFKIDGEEDSDLWDVLDDFRD